jgi:hypothetical protein
VDARDHLTRGRNAAAVGDRLTHASQLVQARLDDIKHGVVGGDGAVVDLHDERFQLVAEVAHPGDARHAGATLQRM